MPRIKELAAQKNGWVPYIVDSEAVVWGVPEGKVGGWLASYPDDTAADLEEFFKEAIESPGECQVKFHCFRKEPLRLGVLVADEGLEVADDWWLR